MGFNSGFKGLNYLLWRNLFLWLDVPRTSPVL